MHRIYLPKKSENETHQPLQLVHSDLCGLMNVDSVDGSKYVLTFTDDYTGYVTAYFIKSKSEVLSKFVEYVTMMCEYEPLEVTMVASILPSTLKSFVLTRGLRISSPTRTHQGRMAFQKDRIAH